MTPTTEELEALLECTTPGESASAVDERVIAIAPELAREVERLRARIDALEEALYRIEGGDNPTDDPIELQRIAHAALMGLEGSRG
jgi:hypothetical protein